jgi:hypothetical protein
MLIVYVNSFNWWIGTAHVISLLAYTCIKNVNANSDFIIIVLHLENIFWRKHLENIETRI